MGGGGAGKEDAEAARAPLSAAVSLVLRLLGRDPDPAKSREHVLLSVLAERRLRAGLPSDLGSLLADVTKPPFETIGALSVDRFLSKRQRAELASAERDHQESSVSLVRVEERAREAEHRADAAALGDVVPARADDGE